MKKICNDQFMICYEKSNHPYNKVKIIFCEFCNSKFDASLYENLIFKEPDSIKVSVQKRRAEFLAGRMAAINALKLMGEHACEIPIGEHRNPIWPVGVTGSITHYSNTALAVVANKEDAKFVGIDCEGIMSLELAESISNIILTDNERSYSKENNIPYRFFCTLIFSAKESLFKAIYPYICQYIEFDAANVIDICLLKNTFKIKLTKKITSDFDIGRCFNGYFEIESNHIVTMIICNDC